MTRKRRFVICINTKGYEASLILKKIYQVLPDKRAEQDDFLRVLAESSEDYLFHSSHFVFIELPKSVEQILVAV